ncbi:glycosyltransferase family 9 protein [Candidatus Woesearchaeota archaeon]|nr:glycosyltransferase family 9 protein [Candidatus Woesearchaeota archaeon]
MTKSILKPLKQAGWNGSQRMIFIALNGIGNTIILTPALVNLKKNWPKSYVTVLTLRDSVGIISSNPYIDDVIVYPSKKSLLSRIVFLLKLRRQKYDISFYPYPNVNIMSALFAFIIGAKCRVNFYYRFLGKWSGIFDSISVPVDLEKHDIEKNLDLLRALNLKIYSKNPCIYIKKEDTKYVDGLLKNNVKRKDILIGMHVGSKEGMRIWHTENFASLAKKLSADKRVKILLVGTDIEMNLIKDFGEFKKQNIINLINKTTIPQTTALIGRCKLFVTTDSGPMHMAVAAGTRVIAVYLGPHIKRTAPYGKKHIVFLTNKATHKEDKNKNHIYVDKVTPDMVFKKIRKIL